MMWHRHAQRQTHTHIHRLTHPCTHTYTPVHTHSRTNTSARTHICARAQVRTDARAHTRRRARAGLRRNRGCSRLRYSHLGQSRLGQSHLQPFPLKARDGIADVPAAHGAARQNRYDTDWPFWVFALALSSGTKSHLGRNAPYQRTEELWGVRQAATTTGVL